ncbi:hypothetical protein P168DRAFT_283682 [Aspergillus campestris IBT 28561]|uniref:Protein kinase domain-containing protein n=1 Tax=Aspergillus campestris (strain IBT 28561) TaxID=1392248 RepID=A0A2I1CWA9_ASPC2|nr:uncharacterized protein P168DRAFT_283682 [Aspergillus campestris IBT 28561]PKY01905.1 hypothetical protein P168DRAFT_283682 [Aspergillus campestris IBT 28561]
MTAATQYCNQAGEEDFGDFVEMDLEEIAEPCDKYDKQKTPDVFYPIRLGDLINQRANGRQNTRDVALKMMFAGESGQREIRLQDEIVRNLLEALRILHEAGIVHRGLNGKNWKFHLDDFGLAKKVSDPETPRGYPPLQDFVGICNDIPHIMISWPAAKNGDL